MTIIPGKKILLTIDSVRAILWNNDRESMRSY